MSEDEKLFFKADLTTNLFTWLKFSQSINRSIDQPDLSNQATLAGKIENIQAERLAINHIGFAFGVAGLAFGLIAVSSIIGYSNSQPANLWLVVAIFAGWPLLTALVSVITGQFGNKPSIILQSLYVSIKRLSHFPFHSINTGAQTHLIMKWLAWRWQLFSIGFIAGSLIGFIVIVLFWDVSFGWSSTLANSQQWMEPLVHIITWPSHWFLGAPSIELINASQLTRYNPTQDAVLLRQWWPYVFFCIFCYGFLSRCLLYVWKSLSLKASLVRDIRKTGAIERFNAKRSEARSVYMPLLKPSAKDFSIETLDASELQRKTLFGWQFNHRSINTKYNFGVNSWAEDLNWLEHKSQLKEESEITILVHMHCTPVIELIDLLEEIQRVEPNISTSIGLVLLPNDQQNELRFESTWAQFSFKHKAVCFYRYLESSV